MGKFKSALTVTALVAGAGGALLLGMGNASAQGTATPWAPGGVDQDANAVGGLSFFDASGNLITSGQINNAPFAAYVEGRVAPRVTNPTDTKATLYMYIPVAGQTPDTWTTNEQITLSTTYPNASAPGALATATLPVTSGSAANDTTLATIASDEGSTSTASGYQNIYEIRMYTNHAGGTTSATYDYADVTINTANNTWALAYTPDAPVATTTTLTASPSPANVGATVTLSATVSPTAAGTVQFEDGSTPIGSPVTVTAGVATTTDSALALGSHTLNAVFSPSSGAFLGSTGTTTEVIQTPKTPTTTTLAQSGSTQYTGSDVTFTATVASNPVAGETGSVQFFDNGSSTPLAGTVTNPSTGSYVLDEPTGLPVGAHSVVAVYTPTDTTDYAGSTSSAVTFNTANAPVGACASETLPDSCTAVSNIQAEIPVGTLDITTPYTAGSPLDLGNLVLQPNATEFKGTAAFTNIAVTDTRSGAYGWTLSALSSNLTDGGSLPSSTINSQNIGLTSVIGVPGAGFTGTVTPVSNPAADPAVGSAAVLQAAGQQGLGINPHTVASAPVGTGPGTYTMSGTLTITAPTSTEPGTFTGTITFTVG
ncbi:MAG TPA: Ig-like domain-containing protein [Jatrophihabitantaceae bacterium]|jgi:hypothetical protein|nr:Ig-like domain-containing protein [Jatrophihabitantaceae bacterium]